MSYRMHGIPASFELDTDTVSDKKIGQLVSLNADGKYTTEVTAADAFALPLVRDVQEAEGAVDVTISGVAKVYVESAAGIVAGSEVGIGATGLGVAVYDSGFKLGIALDVPRGDGDYIPVLLAPVAGATIY